MRIVYLMDQMYTHGGAEKILSLKMNALVNDFESEVFLCTSEQADKLAVYPISKKVNWIDLKINYHRQKSYFHPINLIKTIQHFFKLNRVILKIKPHVIISVSQTPEQYFLPFIHKKIPKVKEFHSSGINYKRARSITQKLKYRLFLLYHKYSTVVVLNKDEKEFYPFNNKVVIPNFIKEEIQTLSKYNKQRKKIIIAAGRIAPVKQFDHLIKAWSLIANKFPHWEVHIYGEGDKLLLEQLKLVIKKLNIPNIKLMGATSFLNEKMKKASIYAMTSKTECFPMVLLESLSCGLPIISYDCPFGPKNIITNREDGILVGHNNIKALASELAKLIEDQELRKKMKKNARNNVKRFDEKIIMQQWVRLFNNIKK